MENRANHVWLDSDKRVICSECGISPTMASEFCSGKPQEVKLGERIAEVGYINREKKHAIVSIFDPPILNASETSVQVVLTIEGAAKLRDELETFLKEHQSD